ncbi:MAG: HIT family protein [Herpetosiphonaceae bacterium]|nr:HIT family protein [Herpetosiphonaceae bacterium]
MLGASMCPFCDPLVWQRESVGIDNELCLFISRPALILPGSGIIITRRHCPTLFEMTSEEWQASYDVLQRVQAYLDALFHPAGYNIGWNVGAIGGQEVFHVHMHVIPRFADEPLAGKGIRYWLKQEANRRPDAGQE